MPNVWSSLDVVTLHRRQDAEPEELLLDGAFDAEAGAGGEDQAIVGDQS